MGSRNSLQMARMVASKMQNVSDLDRVMPFIRFNHNFIVTEASNYCLEYFAIDKDDELIGKSIFETILKNASPTQCSKFIENFNSSKFEPLEFHFIHKDRPYHTLWQSYRTSDVLKGEILTSVIIDIATLTAKNGISGNSDEIRKEAFLEIGPNGNIVHANEIAMRYLGILDSDRREQYQARAFIDMEFLHEYPDFDFDKILRIPSETTIKFVDINLDPFVAKVKTTPYFDNKRIYLGSLMKIDPIPNTYSYKMINIGSAPKDILTALPDIILVINENKELTYLSEQFWQKMGMEEDYASAMITPFSYIHKDDLDMVNASFDRVIAVPGATDTFVCRHWIGNEKYAWIEVHSVNMIDNPKIRGIVSVIRKIDQRIEKKKRDEDNVENLKKIAKYANLLIFIFDLDGNIIHSSGKGFTTIFQMSAEKLTGSNINDVVLQDEAWKSAMEKVLNKKDNRSMFTIQNHNLMGVFSPILNQFQEMIGITLIASDFADTYKVEKEREELITELRNSRETIIEESNKLLELNKRLEVSQDNLNRVNMEKDKFFSIISHDLRSPLSGITGTLESLLTYYDSYSSTEVKDTVASLVSSANNLYKLLDNLLIWSRMQRGVMVNTPDAIPANIIVNNVHDLLKQNALQKNIKLDRTVDDSLVVFTDYNMASTILRNLVSNAIKFTPNGGTIIISAKQSDGNFAEFSVRDSGVGISPEDIDKLFKIEVNHTTHGTNNEQGTGLGLILCKEMVHLNKGEIWVESEVGKGSTFRFTIPLYSDDTEDKVIEEAIEEPKAEVLSESLCTIPTVHHDLKPIYTEVCLDSKEYKPSQELLQALPMIIPRLEFRFAPLRENVVNNIMINDILKFTVQLKRFGEEYKLPCVRDYAFALYDKAFKMNVPELRKMMIEYFDMVIRRLKGFLGIEE